MSHGKRAPLRAASKPAAPAFLAVLGCLVLAPGCTRKIAPVQPTAPQRPVACPASERCSQLFCDQVAIPGGPFTMGWDGEPHGVPPDYFGGLDRSGDPRPAHTVVLEPFCIDRYEVTVERYEACVQAGICSPDAGPGRTASGGGSFRTRVNHYPEPCMDRGERCPTCPVNCRSYRQARDYCAWIGRRLCTEAEWERVASGSGPAKRPYPWGSATIDSSLANVAGTGPGYVLPVDSLPAGASSEDVFNLAGNVFEWVEGTYREYLHPGGDPPPATAGGTLRVGRGGCFHTDIGYSSWDRTTFHPDFDWGCIGIRCCASPIAQEESSARLVASRISLPPAGRNPAGTAFQRLLATRRSTRDFSREALAQEEASDLLWAGQGSTGPEGGRTAPSAGALHPLELLLVVSRVEGLEPGVYRYDPAGHAVSLLAAGEFAPSLCGAALSQEAIGEAAAIIVLIGLHERTAIKYGDRAERYVLLEAGHAAQNILLQATELGLGAVPIGAFQDEEVRRILGTAAAPIYLVPVGRPGI